MVVDEQWSLVGSANWDPRSLRLNFEVGVECHDPGFAVQLARWVDDRISVARAVSMDEVERRSVGIRLRDGFARLFAPYL
jgi:cardiolipin synthase